MSCIYCHSCVVSGNLKYRMYAVWKCESAENKWPNVGEQQSMMEIVQKLNHNSIYFLNLDNFQ